MVDLRSEVRTLIDTNSGEPKIVFTILNGEQIVLPIAFSPEEARFTAKTLLEAAEAIEQDAHVVVTLRSLKFPEDTIAQVIHNVRLLRETELGSVTLAESQEEVDPR
jgi:hypothetical protein